MLSVVAGGFVAFRLCAWFLVCFPACVRACLYVREVCGLSLFIVCVIVVMVVVIVTVVGIVVIAVVTVALRSFFVTCVVC